jgi:hypothetical protein
VRLVDGALDGAFLAGMTHGHAPGGAARLTRFFRAMGKVAMAQEAIESAAHGRHCSADASNLPSAHHA